jgi:hypothetical protein
MRGLDAMSQDEFIMTAHNKGLSYFLLRMKSGGAICQVRDGRINCSI